MQWNSAQGIIPTESSMAMTEVIEILAQKKEVVLAEEVKMAVKTVDKTSKTTPKMLEEDHIIKDKTELFVHNIKMEQSQQSGTLLSRHMTLIVKAC